MLTSLILLFAVSSPALQNPGFEEPGPLSGWRVYLEEREGRDPVIRVDSSEFKEGKQSLLLDPEDPAHLTVGQRLYLPVGSLWRVKGWVKSENLNVKDRTGVTGVIDIQTPAGSLGRTESRKGTSAWQEERVIFRVASPGEINVVLVHTMDGKATGRVWFDGIQLESIPEDSSAGPEHVHISSRKLTQLPIDPKQGGQFIEPLCSLIPSMTAQQVNSTSFEEEPPCHFVYRRETDKPYHPWYPDGAVHLAQFSLDTENPFNGKLSQKIQLPAAHSRAGISQDCFYLKKGLTYQLKLHMRGERNVLVQASLSGGAGSVAAPVSLGHAGPQWAEAGAEFRATQDLDCATLTIDFEGPGILWLDRIYLIGEDAVLGIWRPDVVAALKAMNPGVIRFGGTAIESYEWDQSIGPWNKRVPFTTWWGNLEPNFVGEEEFVQLCHLVVAEPLICLRWTGKTPADAAAQVEYFNGGAETLWGRLRAQNGHPEPYQVKYWQIGNEVGGPEYDASVKPIAEAIKRVDPTVKILSSFPSDETLKHGQGLLDYLSPHHYAVADFLGMERDFKNLQDQVMRYGAGKPVRVAVTEWNATAGQWGLGRGMLQTLGNALSCSRYHNFIHRYADLTEIAIRSNLVDSFGSGVIITGPGWMYLAPTYYAQQLYSRSAQSYPLQLERTQQLAWHLQEPNLSATLSQDGKTLRIYAVNSTSSGLQLRFHLKDLGASIVRGTQTVLKDREEVLSSEVMNSFNQPRRIALVSFPAEIKGREFESHFEPLSLTLLELELE
jgi:alpha-L-arabinofuranosidase